MDEDEFHAWLEGQPQEVCAAIAMRAALRVVPLVTLVRRPDEEDLLLALLTLRGILTAGIAVARPTHEARAAANAAALAADSASFGDTPAHDAADAAAHAAAVAGGAASDVPDAARDTGAAAYAAARAVSKAFDSSSDADAATFAAATTDTRIPSDALTTTAIQLPPELKDTFNRLRETHTDLLNSGDPWTFWAEWYARAMAGDPLPWDLQREIASIPDEEWEKGPELIAEKIAEIRARYQLNQRIRELEEERERIAAENARHGIGGNNPPEPIDHDGGIPREVTVVWAAIDELKAETASDTPDKSRVGRIIETLSKGLQAIRAWLGRRIEVAVETLIVVGVTKGADAVITKPELLDAVIDAARAWWGIL